MEEIIKMDISKMSADELEDAAIEAGCDIAYISEYARRLLDHEQMTARCAVLLNSVDCLLAKFAVRIQDGENECVDNARDIHADASASVEKLLAIKRAAETHEKDMTRWASEAQSVVCSCAICQTVRANREML